MSTAKRGQESIQIAAESAIVYDLLADITRMGEWSPECYRGAWLGRSRSTSAFLPRLPLYEQRPVDQLPASSPYVSWSRW
jgi:hypothetical protein